MDIKPCNPYISSVIGKKNLAFPGGSSFKLYYVSLTGRARPENNDWAHAAFKPEDFEKKLAENPPEGVGFITAFVPITKVFRFAPAGETIMHVKAFRTQDLEPLDLVRPDGYTEFACYAEAAIVADEYRRWAEAKSVKEYLEYSSPFTAGAIADHAKLAAYWK
jgi:hypothetical protein